MIKGSPPSKKLRALPSMGKDEQTKASGHGDAIRNYNITIAILSALLFLVVVVLPWKRNIGPTYIARGNVGKNSTSVADPFWSKWENCDVDRSSFGGRPHSHLCSWSRGFELLRRAPIRMVHGS